MSGDSTHLEHPEAIHEDTPGPGLIDPSDSRQSRPSFTSESDRIAPAPPASEQHEQPQTVSGPPQVAALHAMFPDFDEALLASVLESVGYDQDRAVDVLLGMSDPEYISTEAPVPLENDLALDEQLARQLALEDEEQAPRARGQSWPRRQDVPYEPRHNAPAQSPSQQQRYAPANERGDFAEIQETLGRVAESGKRTFSSIVSKAKAKINEYNQQRSAQASTSPYTSQAQWNAARPQQYDRHAASQAYAQQYYDYDSGHPQASNDDPPTTFYSGKSAFEHENGQVAGYDPGYGADASASASSKVAAPPTYSDARPSSPPTVTQPASSLSSSRVSGDAPPPPPRTASGSPFDTAKLGLLPKKPVSLLNTTQAQHRPDDEDELDYVENPFEEGHD